MNAQDLEIWLKEHLKLAEPLDCESTLADPQHVAVTATKKLALLKAGSGALSNRAYRVGDDANQCAAILAECLRLLPSEQPESQSKKSSKTSPDDWLDAKDVAKIINKSVNTVRDWCRDGYLRASNISQSAKPRWKIKREHVDEFLASREREPVTTTPRRASKSSSNGKTKRYGSN